MSKSTRPTLRPRPSGEGSPSFRLERRNVILIGAGIATVIAGFYLLSIGSTVVAPILLIVGFLVLIPWGIITGVFARRDADSAVTRRKRTDASNDPGRGA